MATDLAMQLQLPVERLGAEAQDLPPAERRAADVLLARFSELDRETTATIAKAANVDPATVVRTSRRLGFAGFDDLKLAAARATGTGGRSSLAAERIDNDELSLVRQSMLGDAHQIAAAAETIDEVALEAMAHTLLHASTALFTAVGSSATILGLAALRFLTIGVRVAWYADSQAQLTVADLLDERGAVLALSRSGRSPEVLAVARAAKARDATVLVLTCAPRSPLAATADELVVFGPATAAQSERYLTRTVDAAVLNALETLAYRHEHAKTKRKLSQEPSSTRRRRART